MPDSFYKEEHYVTQVIADILSFTQVGFDIYLSPAIRNHLNKYWHEIVVDGRKYIDKGKKESAYDILKSIIHDMRCQLFQSEGRWYIEGINTRHLQTVKFDTYSPTGDYLESYNIDKNVKVVHWSPTPTISVIPGLREVTVTHTASELNISSEVYKETNIKWIKGAGVLGRFLPRHWDYTIYQPKHRNPEYFLELPVSNTSTLDEAKKITLKEKPYLLKGYKVKMKLEFELINDTFQEITRQQIEDRRASGIWIDMQKYKIKLNENTVLSNFNTAPGDTTRLVFKDDLKASASLEFIAGENGYLDVELYEPIGYVPETLINRVRLTNVTIENIEQEKDFVYTEFVNEESSRVQEIELSHSDDISTKSKAFYLEKLREYPEHEGTGVLVPIRYGRPQNGKNYSFVSVEGAALIEQFPNKVGYLNYFDRIAPPKVHYNLHGGEEMAIETEELYTEGSFYVLAQAYEPATIDRIEWLKWSDAVYNVEQKPYAQVVAEIESKLFRLPHLGIEATVQAPIKFNDIILKKYNNQNRFLFLIL